MALRKKVNEIDERILYFLKERMKVCASIGALKKKHKIPVRDYQREDEVYTNIMKKASEMKLDPQEVKAIYQKIMAMCARIQESDTKI